MRRFIRLQSKNGSPYTIHPFIHPSTNPFHRMTSNHYVKPIHPFIIHSTIIHPSIHQITPTPSNDKVSPSPPKRGVTSPSPSHWPLAWGVTSPYHRIIPHNTPSIHGWTHPAMQSIPSIQPHPVPSRNASSSHHPRAAHPKLYFQHRQPTYWTQRPSRPTCIANQSEMGRGKATVLYTVVCIG